MRAQKFNVSSESRAVPDGQPRMDRRPSDELNGCHADGIGRGPDHQQLPSNTKTVNERRHGLTVRSGPKNNRSSAKTREFCRDVDGICVEVSGGAKL